MSSETRTCVDCKREFTWSYGEQRYFRERNLQPPKHCKDCLGRQKQKLNPGMRSEVGEPVEFFPTDQQSSGKPQPPVSTQQPAQPPSPLPQPAPKFPQPTPGSWWSQPGRLSTAIVLWLVLVLFAFRIISWPAGVAVVVLGVALYLWIVRRQ